MGKNQNRSYDQLVSLHTKLCGWGRPPKSWKDNPPPTLPEPYAAHLHNLKLGGGKDPNRPSTKEKLRRYEKIKKKAAEVLELLKQKDTYVSIADKVGGYEEMWENVGFMEDEVFDILGRLATFETPDITRSRLDGKRTAFFRNMFQEFWTKDKNPTGTAFINFCVEALAEAHDPLEYSTVKTLIERQPREFWFEDWREKIKLKFSEKSCDAISP